MTLATTMSTTLQRQATAGIPRGFTGDGERDVDVCIVAPPCAGMIQIRFDGRSVVRFLSARLTGLPCVRDEYTPLRRCTLGS